MIDTTERAQTSVIEPTRSQHVRFYASIKRRAARRKIRDMRRSINVTDIINGKVYTHGTDWLT
jgi:hypothetical protein